MKKNATLVERACKSVPGYEILYKKLERHVVLTGKSESTLTNYSRCLARMALHFQCSPIEPDHEQVLDYLQYLKSRRMKPKTKSPNNIITHIPGPVLPNKSGTGCQHGIQTPDCVRSECLVIVHWHFLYKPLLT